MVDHIVIAGMPASIAPSQGASLTATAYDAGGNPIPGVVFTWVSSNAVVATVDSSGVVTAGVPGQATISAFASGVAGSVTATCSDAYYAAPSAGDVSTFIGGLWQPYDPFARVLAGANVSLTVDGTAIPSTLTVAVPTLPLANVTGATFTAGVDYSIPQRLIVGTDPDPAGAELLRVGGDILSGGTLHVAASGMTEYLPRPVGTGFVRCMDTTETVSAGRIFAEVIGESPNSYGWTRNDIYAAWGYNAGAKIGYGQVGEHATYLTIENFFGTSPTDAQTEIYLEHIVPNGTHTVRPFAINIDVAGTSANTATPNVDWLLSVGSWHLRDQTGLHSSVDWNFLSPNVGYLGDRWNFIINDNLQVAGYAQFSDLGVIVGTTGGPTPSGRAGELAAESIASRCFYFGRTVPTIMELAGSQGLQLGVSGDPNANQERIDFYAGNALAARLTFDGKLLFGTFVTDGLPAGGVLTQNTVGYYGVNSAGTAGQLLIQSLGAHTYVTGENDIWLARNTFLVGTMRIGQNAVSGGYLLQIGGQSYTNGVGAPFLDLDTAASAASGVVWRSSDDLVWTLQRVANGTDLELRGETIAGTFIVRAAHGLMATGPASVLGLTTSQQTAWTSTAATTDVVVPDNTSSALRVRDVAGNVMFMVGAGGQARMYGGSNVTGGTATLAPAASAYASLNVPAGSAPATPNDGDIWFDGTAFMCRIGGVTRTIQVV